MRRENWTNGISMDFDLEASNHFTGEVIENPNLEHLGITLPGTLYGVNPYALKESLRIYYHYVIGEHVHLHEILTDTVLGLNNGRDKRAVVIGMGLTGFTISGFDYIDSDGVLYDGDRPNDLDFLVATQNLPHQELMPAINAGVDKMRETFLLHTKLLPVTWEKSKWKNGATMGNLYYEKTRANGKSTLYNPAEFGHIDRVSLQESVDYAHRYIGSFYSNVIGSPLFFLAPDENGYPKHYIWQPFEFDTAAPHHMIELAFPESFNDNIRCLKEIPRGIHYLYLAQSAAKYYEPQDRVAQLSQATKQVFKSAVGKYREEGIPSKIVEACKARLHSCIWRSDQLAKGHKDTWKASHTFEEFPEYARELYARILDEIGWGKIIFGETVSEYLEKEAEKT